MVQRDPNLTLVTRVERAVTRFLVIAGFVLSAFYLVAQTHSEVLSQMGLSQFSALQQAHPAESDGLVGPKHALNYDLWSPKRIAAYQEKSRHHFASPLAVLEISKIGLEVPVFEGTDDLTLNRGVGRIVGTARPGEGGNVGIAGHRDGFFRGLKDLTVGDEIYLRTLTGTKAYEVTRILITDPTDVQMLDQKGTPALTLVTCYPFYFIGSAPQRYIVRAEQSDRKFDGKASVRPGTAMGRSED